ncbi:hypothetical protein ACLOJK_036710 [Asimina triloba]
MDKGWMSMMELMEDAMGGDGFGTGGASRRRTDGAAGGMGGGRTVLWSVTDSARLLPSAAAGRKRGGGWRRLPMGVMHADLMGGELLHRAEGAGSGWKDAVGVVVLGSTEACCRWCGRRCRGRRRYWLGRKGWPALEKRSKWAGLGKMMEHHTGAPCSGGSL